VFICYKSSLKSFFALILIVIVINGSCIVPKNNLNKNLKSNNLNFYENNELKLAVNASFSYDLNHGEYFELSSEADISVRYNYSTEPSRNIQVILLNQSEYLHFINSEPVVSIYLGTEPASERSVYFNYSDVWHVIFTNVELLSTEVNGTYEFKSNPSNALPLTSSDSKADHDNSKSHYFWEEMWFIPLVIVVSVATGILSAFLAYRKVKKSNLREKPRKN